MSFDRLLFNGRELESFCSIAPSLFPILYISWSRWLEWVRFHHEIIPDVFYTRYSETHRGNKYLRSRFL